MNIKNKFYKNKTFLFIILLLSTLRLYIGYYSPIWYRSVAKCDDLLLLSYSQLHTHFLNWNNLSLAKTMSYPLFLAIVRISKIPYTCWLSILWIIAGLIVIYAIYKFINKNKLLLILVFGFITFLPIAFDSMPGLRIYRNAIMAPMATICLTSLFIFISLAISKNKNHKELIFWAIISGLFFTFNFYIKEDGILTMPIFIASLMAVIIFNLYEIRSKKVIKYVIICIIPLLIFGATTFAYKEVNNYYFGIDEINTRTGGEIGEFWQNLLKIDDENKTTTIWVPVTTLEKAWEASPTLHSHPELLESLKTSVRAKGNITKHPIKGDHVAWALRSSLSEVGLFDNETEANDLFEKVNDELDDAFKTGKLNKSNKIFITASANGKSINEIYDIQPFVTYGFECCAFYKDIKMDKRFRISSRAKTNPYLKRDIESVLNQHLFTQKELDNPSLAQKIAFKLIKLDISVYQIISYLITFISLVSFLTLGILQFKNKFKNRQNNLLLGFEFLLLATFLVEIFAIGWFSSWLALILVRYYTVANHGIFALFEVLSITNIIKIKDMLFVKST